MLSPEPGDVPYCAEAPEARTLAKSAAASSRASEVFLRLIMPGSLGERDNSPLTALRKAWYGRLSGGLSPAWPARSPGRRRSRAVGRGRASARAAGAAAAQAERIRSQRSPGRGALGRVGSPHGSPDAAEPGVRASS